MTNEKPRKKDSARLTWDTKPRRAANPKDIEFQTAEVVIPNPQTAGELPLSFRDGLIGDTDIDKQKMNRLIWGDNLLAMQALLAQGYEGKINLIYIDPPFDSKADYSHKLTIEGNEYTKEPSVIERLAYKDTWAGGTDSYLDMLYPRLQLMKRLLTANGSIYIHCDWRVHAYIRIILDEVFGRESFRASITWRSMTPSGFKGRTSLGRSKDDILYFSKSPEYFVYNPQKVAYSEDYLRTRFNKIDEKGRRFKDEKIGTATGEATIKRLSDEGRIYITTQGTLRIKHFLDEADGYYIDDLWTDIVHENSQSENRTGYATQKPDALLNRIINASSNEGDLVADFFAGSGTTGAVAERLGRRWIMCELGKVGIQVTRARMVEQGAKPFLIENIGNYQREMIYLTGGRISEMQTLILKLYGATPRDRLSGLGTRKAQDGVEELVYVGYPDRPVTARKAEELAVQAQKLDGTGYKRLVILGWDYEYNYHQALESRLNALKDKLKIKIESRDIPPDIYDYLKKAKSEEDIEALADKVQFFQRPYLKLESPVVTASGGKVEVTLGIKRYVLMDIPISRDTTKGKADYEALVKVAKDNFAVLIDYWAVDWDYDGFTFKSQWQAFRGNGKKAKTVPVTATETLEKKGKRIVAVRVVDIFGNDAAATIEVSA